MNPHDPAKRPSAHLVAAFEHLVRAVSAYQRLLPEPARLSSAQEYGQHLDQAAEQEPGRNDDWAVAGKRRAAALRAVDQGGLRLCRTAIGNDPYVSGVSSDRPSVWPETVERMLADGLLTIDTSTSVYKGQLLSLTDQGESTLRAAAHGSEQEPNAKDLAHASDRLPAQEELPALDPRTSAALRRSAHNARPAPEQKPPSAPGTAWRPTRSR